MSIRSNFSGVTVFESGGPALALGTHKFKVQEVVAGQSQAGNPAALVRLECIGTLGTSEEARECIGRTIRRTIPTDGGGAFRWKQFLLGCGYSEEDLGGEIEIDEKDLEGALVWAYVTRERTADGEGYRNDLTVHFGDAAKRDEAQLVQMAADGTSTAGAAAQPADGTKRPARPQRQPAR